MLDQRMARPGKLFYGWWIAIAAAIGLGLGGPPILVFSFPIFLKALTKDFQASRSAVALAFSLHNLVSAFMAPLIGRVVDRVAIRKVVISCTALFALLLISNRLITVAIGGIYLLNIVGAVLTAGCGPVAYSAVVSKWFDRRRGTALAVMMAGLGISAIVMPSFIQLLISNAGWRAAYAIYGLVMLAVPLPIIFALLKDSPADLGLASDGAPPRSAQPEGPIGITSREARRSSTFWILVSAVVLLGASVHACLLHLAAMLTDEGIAVQTAALASSIAGFGILGGRLTTGILLDRYFGPRVAMCFSGCAAFGAALLLLARSGLVPFIAAFFVGLGMGAEGDLIGYLTSRYFGLKSFGEIYGLTFGSFVLAGACGTFLMGVGFDRTGSYATPLFGFLMAILAALLLFSRLGPYRYLPVEHEEAIPQRAAAAAQG